MEVPLPTWGMPEKTYADPDRPTQVSHHSSYYVEWLEQRITQLEDFIQNQEVRREPQP